MKEGYWNVLNAEYSALSLRLVADIAVLLPSSHHHPVNLRPAHDGRKYGARRFVVGETSLDATRTAVDYDGPVGLE